MKTTISVILLGILVLISVGGYAAYKSLDAEKTLHAQYLVLELLQEYVTCNSGAWPKNWGDLESSTPKVGGGMWKWPEEIEEVKKRVWIDFSLKPQDILNNSEECKAIKPLTESYPVPSFRVDKLREIIQTELEKQDNSLHQY